MIFGCKNCTHRNDKHLKGKCPVPSCGCPEYVRDVWVSPPEVEKEAWHEFTVSANFKCYGLERHVDQMLTVITSEMKLQFGSSFIGLEKVEDGTH